MRIKKFNEGFQVKEDLFTNEEILDDILIEYIDSGYKYSKLYKFYKLYEGYLMPIKTYESRKNNDFFNKSTNDVFDTSQENYPDGVIRAYQIEFAEIYNTIIATDKQRGVNVRFFGEPNNKLYDFFKITKDIQERIEFIGYQFLLSVHQDAEFDILIVEPY